MNVLQFYPSPQLSNCNSKVSLPLKHILFNVVLHQPASVQPWFMSKMLVLGQGNN